MYVKLFQVETLGHRVHEATTQQSEHCSRYRESRLSHQKGGAKTQI